jgi:long-chain fatty acid transport protein
MAAAADPYAELTGAEYKTEMEDDFNYSFNFGLLYEFNEKVALGIAFRTESKTHMEGRTDVTPDLEMWQNQNVDASVDIDTPNQLQVGIEYKPIPRWSINFDVTRTWWGSIQDYSVKFDDPYMATPGITDGANEEYYDREWKNVFQYRIGTEYKLNEHVDLRAGYYYDPSVVPGNTFDVQWPDADKHVFSGGVGIHMGRVTVDLTLQYIKIEDVHINGDSHNLNETFTRPGYHEGEVYATASGHLIGYGATVSYSF